MTRSCFSKLREPEPMTLPDCAREQCMPEIEFTCQASMVCATCAKRTLLELAVVVIHMAHIWSGQASGSANSRELTICDLAGIAFYAQRDPSQMSWRDESIRKTERLAYESHVDFGSCAKCARLCQVAQKGGFCR